MLKYKETFSSFSAKDIQRSKDFYSSKLGLDVVDEMEGTISLTLSDGNKVLIYPKEDHTPAAFTVLNFIVDDGTKPLMN